MKNNRKPNITGWVSVVSAALFFFYWFIQLSLSNTLVEYYTQKYSIIHYGLFASMYLIGNVLMFIPAGVLLDRFPAKKVIGLSMIVMILGVFGMIGSSNTWFAYTCMLFIGFSGAFSLLACVRVAANWFHEGSVGFPISVAITIAFLGSYFGNAGAQALLAYFGSGEAVQIIDIIIGVIILCIVYFGIKTPLNVSFSHDNQSFLVAFKNLLTVMGKRQNWLAGLYISLMNFPVMILEFGFGQSYLDHVFSISKLNAANITGVISIGFMIGGPLWNKMSDKAGLRKPFIILGGVLSLGITLLLLAHDFNTRELMIIFFLIGVLISAQTLGYPVITESNDFKFSASATSLASLLIMGGGAIAQIFFGFVETSLSYSAAYMIIPACMVIAIILGIFIKETEKV
ncbi:MAG: MFS family permease [Francisellaceae bacterium]|jgi:MFS family permease